MLIPSLVALVISCLSVYLSLNSQEEIIQLVSSCIALASLLLSFVLAPWLVLLILVVPLVGYKFKFI